MKKRHYFSIAITFILLACTHNFWITTDNQKTLFDAYPFLIILICGYLIALKVTSYIADFKNIKHKSRIEIIFLTIFFIMLFIPMSHISNKKFSTKENRTLATRKHFIEDNKINYNFGKDFDSWFNDSFFTRHILIDLYLWIKYNLANTYYETQQGFFNKQTGWMSDTKIYSSQDKASQEQKELTKQSLIRLKNFADKNDIKLYIIIAPKKNEICNKELSPFYGNFSNYKKTRDMIDYIESNKIGIPILYPYSELEQYQRKTGKAYFKTDHHWTDDASYNTAYLNLINIIKKDFNDIKIANPGQFKITESQKIRVNDSEGYHTGRTYKALKLHDRKLLKTSYKYYDYKYYTKPCNHKYIKDNSVRYHKFAYQTPNKYNMVLFGDSFTLNLMHTLSSSFANSKILYTWSIGNNNVFNINRKIYKTEILETKPNILVICLSEIDRLQYVFLDGSEE